MKTLMLLSSQEMPLPTFHLAIVISRPSLSLGLYNLTAIQPHLQIHKAAFVTILLYGA